MYASVPGFASQGMLMPMRFFPSAFVLLSVAATLPGASAAAQTADRSAAPPSSSTTAPPASRDSYSVQNGDLIVAPGLRIPNGNVPWALDSSASKQVLVPIHHSALGTASDSMGTLVGASSHTPLHSGTPYFFIHTSDRTENAGDSGRGSPTGWALVLATPKDGSRTIAQVKFSQVTSATVCTPPVLCTQAETLPDGWLRLTPREPLVAGEYALLPVPRTANAAISVVYDFTVDDGQPAAKDAVSPGQNLDQPAGKKKKNK
jgi:hypothetical protein